MIGLLLPMFSFAQDKIIMNDGTERDAYIRSEFGRYIRYTDNNGNQVAVDKNTVSAIKYNENNLAKRKNRDLSSENLGQNIISYNYFALVHQNVGFIYERIFKSGYTSIKIPLQFSIGTPNFYTYRPTFVSGVDFNIYPTGQGLLKYYFGPSIRFGEVSSSDYYYYDPYFNPGPIENENETLSSAFGAFMFTNGLSYQPIEKMNINVLTGLGIRNFEEDFVNNGFSQSFFWFEASVGYRF